MAERAFLGHAVLVGETDLLGRLLHHCIERDRQQYFEPALDILAHSSTSQSALEEQIEPGPAIINKVVSLIQQPAHAELSVDDVVAGLLGRDASQESHDLPAIDAPTELVLRRLVFACLGYLTLLYLPATTLSDEMLAIDVPPMKKVPATSIDSSSVSPRPFHGMLMNFGELFPRPCGQDLRGETLYTSRLSFFSLYRLSSVRVRWVDVLSAHLDFNPITKELVLFRFPSFCLFHSRHVEHVSVFHRLLDAFNTSYAIDANDDRFVDKYPTQALLNEVLLSYRIIFGQDRRSRALFLSLERDKAGRDELLDPWLIRLCGQKKIDLGKLDVACNLVTRTFYSAYDDFPLLGDRLLRLQNYNMQQNSNTLREFWADRRNPFNFYTFWAVIIVGGLSILLSFVQCGLSIAQVVLAARE